MDNRSMKEKFKSWWLGQRIRKGYVPRGRMSQEVIDAIDDSFKGKCGEIWGILSAKVIKKDGSVKNVGVISTEKVTTAFRDYIVASLLNSTTSPLDVFHYHDCGTGTTAEANTQTALVTPYGGARYDGTQIEGATANIFRTVGTITFTSTLAITEHGIFSASSAGTLLDRSVFSAINVVNTDSIAFTYDCTFNAEA